VAGARTVPIELGSSYLSSNFLVKLLSIEGFITDFILTQEKGVGYLAQHNLFEQIPILQQDFRVPDHCSLLLEEDRKEVEDNIQVQSWFGPVGTVSPLHYDSYYNILAQVVGKDTFPFLVCVFVMFPVFFFLNNKQDINLFVYMIQNILRFCKPWKEK
jgi:lysine-specific demethylase 8